MTFDYKTHSLDRLKEWLHDCLSAAEASPQEIYNAIKEVVQEEYYYYKNGASKTYELLTLLNGQVVFNIQSDNTNNVSIDPDPSYNIDPGGNDLTGLYSWGGDYNISEECEHDGMTAWGHSDFEYHIANKKDKVKKWVLPVEETKIVETDETDYFVTFPDDLLEAANLKEGDQIEWVDQGNGSYLLKKVSKTYDEMIAAGWTMTADGFWIKVILD
jgi:bifunctional DNA-binding transcriptional regulator/antitoxin component of YhaV-PrlF toxin-antitoxin module